MRVAISLAVFTALVLGAAVWARPDTSNGEIFYTSGGKGTFVRPDGSGSRSPLIGRGRRAHYVGDGHPVAFSPDGRRAVYTCSDFVSSRVSPYALCVERVDGTGLRQLTRPPKNRYGSDVQPAWSRDGKRIAFVRSLVIHNRPVFRIAVVNADGTREHLLPEPVACRRYHDSRWPDWGPSGELVYDCDTTNVYEALMLAVDLEKAAIPLPCHGTHPRFSPDGSRILVSEDAAGGLATFSVAARGSLSDETCDWGPIVENPYSVSAVWSPDGTEIAFLADEARALYVIGVDGAGLRRLVLSRGDIDEHIAWLPR